MLRDEATALVNSLFDTWYASMVRYASRITGRVDLAEELVQQGFMNLYEELCAGRSIGNPRAWVFCVVRRAACKDIRRHLQREVSLSGADLLDELPAGRAMNPETAYAAGEFSRMLSVLTRREEEVVQLRMEAFKYREIAAQLGISPNSVNVLLARALRKLQAFVKGPAESPALVRRKRDDPKTLQ